MNTINTSRNARAILRITTSGKKSSKVNYSRRMYAILRRYTPEVVEGSMNECFIELTGLRTFFKMSYAELVESILRDLKKEMDISFTVHITKAEKFEEILKQTKKSKHISTYKEINTLFKGAAYIPSKERSSIQHVLRRKTIKLNIPYLGKVS